MARGTRRGHPWTMWLYLVLAVLLAPTGAVAGLYASRIRFSKRIVARTTPAQSSPECCRRTIVVAGDSTAFGVGALPAESTAGRIAAAFPQARVINVARSGARIGHVVEQLGRLGVERADLVLIQACANDVLEFRALDKAEAHLPPVVARPRRLS